MPDYTCATCGKFVGASMPDSRAGRIRYECMNCKKSKFIILPVQESGTIDFESN